MADGGNGPALDAGEMFAIVVDDDPLNNMLTTEALSGLPGCRTRDFEHPAEALAFAREAGTSVGIVLVDYEMPGMDGIALARAIRALPGLATVPVVMVTGHDERELKRAALEAGVNDFLPKPFDGMEVRARARNLLDLSHAVRERDANAARLEREVAEAVATVEVREREIVSLLMRAAEHRDSETGDHIARVAAYVELAAEGLGLPGPERRLLGLASTMHDVGKITVPDAILLKAGPLDADERALMETHAERGRRILAGSDAPIVALAAEIAWTHHERWDGDGYPRRLAGAAIPLAGRIVAVADVFDALTSERPYKQAWPPERARAHLEANAGTHFDPTVVAAFLSRWPDVERVALARTARVLRGAAVA